MEAATQTRDWRTRLKTAPTCRHARHAAALILLDEHEQVSDVPLAGFLIQAHHMGGLTAHRYIRKAGIPDPYILIGKMTESQRFALYQALKPFPA